MGGMKRRLVPVSTGLTGLLGWHIDFHWEARPTAGFQSYSCVSFFFSHVRANC